MKNLSLSVFHRIRFILSLPLKAFLNQTPACLVSFSHPLTAFCFGDFNLKQIGMITLSKRFSLSNGYPFKEIPIGILHIFENQP